MAIFRILHFSLIQDMAQCIDNVPVGTISPFVVLVSNPNCLMIRFLCKLGISYEKL